MKLTFFLLLITFMQVSAEVYSQGKFTLDYKHTSAERVFSRIQKESDYRFFYTYDDIKKLGKVNVQVKNATLPEILDNLLPKGLTYKIVGDKMVVISSLEAINAQIMVKGTVTDSSGTPLAGVTIKVKGENKGVVTDASGAFALVVPDNATLLVSYIGYQSKTIQVDGKSELRIVLQPGVSSLNQLVVVGYGTQSRKDLTSSITSLKPEDLNKGPIADVGKLLQGKVPGLNITASGNPNQDAAVILRGPSTLNSSETPFYVVDGIPGADISSVAPANIASIEVLKDAAATAIYGNRASNGVIMITTKKGSKGAIRVNYNGYIGVEKVSNKLKMMDAPQLRSFLAKDNLSLSPADDKNANTDWQEAVERNSALSFNHYLSVSGGGNHGSYMASVNYFSKEGIIKTSSLQRVIAHMNVQQYALNDKVKFDLNITNSQSDGDEVPMLGNVLLNMITHLPVSPVRNPDGSYFENFTTGNYYNPVSMINNAKDNSKYNDLRGIFKVQVYLPLSITYNVNVSYQKHTSLHSEFYNSYYSKYYNNIYQELPPPSTHQLVNFGENGYALRNTYQNSIKTLETYIGWDKIIGDHHLMATLGYSWQETINGDGFQASTSNFPVDNIGYNNFALSNPYAISSFRVNFGSDGMYQKSRLISDYLRVNYSYKSKYLIQGSIRRDGSSVFGANNQWGYFPSLGVGWRISQEGFMKNQNVFDELKLRGSYGITGNSTGFNPYTAQFISGSAGTFYYKGVQMAAYGPSQAANPDLKWEKTATTNIGLNFTLLNGLISGSLDWYNKKTTGMIYSYAVNPVFVPTGSIVANGGSMSNKGFELALSLAPVKTADFSWTTGINIAHNENEILSLSNPLFEGGDSVRITQPDGAGQTGSTLQILKAGKPLGQFFTLKYAGKDKDGVSQYLSSTGALTTSPAIGVDYYYLGSPQPKLLLGWSNNLRYKNFDLSFFLRAVLGNKLFNATRADLFRPSTAQYTNILKDVKGESIRDVNSYKYSSRFIENGSYVRLANATLGYTFPHLGKYIKSLRIYFTGNNLFIITGYNGIDPEINMGGIAPGIDAHSFYPKTRSLLFGINVLF